MNSSPATPALPVGYSTYKSKRHSRTSSANVVPTEHVLQEQDLQEKLAHQLVDSTPTVRLNGAGNGYTTPALSFGSPASNISLPTPPLNATFNAEPPTPSPSTRAVSPNQDNLRLKTVSPLPFGPSANETPAAELEPIEEIAAPPGAATEETAVKRSPNAPPVTIEVTGPPTVAIPNGRAKEVEKPLPISPSSSASGSQTALKPPLRSAGSTFRRLPARTVKPVNPSPLRPSSSVRTFSNASSASGLSTFSATIPASQSQPVVSAGNGTLPRPASQASRIPFSEPTSQPGSALVSPITSPGLPPPASIDEILPTQRPTSSRASESSAAGSSTPSKTLAQLPYAPRQSFTGSLPVTPAAGPSTPAKQTTSTAPTASSGSTIKPGLAPYRPGFQPKGVYSSRTDEFVALRAKRTDSRKAEEKRLLRRLEKLTELHFSPEPPTPTRTRKSSFLDFSELRSKSAADLWKDVVDTASPSIRSERQIRDAEQSITRWEDDKGVSACRICSQSFRPLTNRKHHCRLCGRIVCSLPPHPPQRPQKCSLLITVDPRTGKVEELPDFIAYGVARRESISSPSPKSPVQGPAKEKEAKGVRVCHDCFNVVMRKQFTSESTYVPPYARLHRAMVRVEQQILEVLPQFQELILSAANGEIHLDRNATQTRKDILEMFAEYDTVAKKIKSLPTVPGSSQERVQAAITARASMFLQQNMLPLKRIMNNRQKQSLSSQASSTGSDFTSPDPLTPNGLGGPVFRISDADSALAHSLQPLLEQEALLESYVDEALQARKFEDAQTLKANLDEIRNEIARMTKDAGRAAKGR